MVTTSCLMETAHLLFKGFNSRGFVVYRRGVHEFEMRHEHGKFSVGLMPGNRRILISFGSFIEPEHRGMGLGKRLLRLRQDVAREAGINLMLATVRDDNRIERHLLRRAGWFILAPRPETRVSLWAKRLRR